MYGISISYFFALSGLSVGRSCGYQHGIVTGFAINKGVDLWFTPNEDGKVHLESRTFDGVVDFDITKGTLVREMHWATMPEVPNTHSRNALT